jgi:ferrochelatase
MSPAFDSVLLLAFGGPTRPEEIRPFLDNVLRGRPIPEARYEEVVQHYIEVGGSSPLNRLTDDLACSLREALRSEGPDLPVFVGMRHWHPYVYDTLARMDGLGLSRAVGIILAPHPSLASRDSYLRAVSDARSRVGEGAPSVEFVDPFFDHPLFIEALAARLRQSLDAAGTAGRSDVAVLFTAHSVPVAMSEESDYERSLRRTAESVARAAGIARWRLVYQSRSGSPSERWLEPDVCEALPALPAEGVREVMVAPIGFVSDHVEVLYDLDIQARAAARRTGLTFHRVPTAGGHPLFGRLLLTLVRDRAARETGR